MIKIVIDWLFHSRNPRDYIDDAPTIRCNCGELMVVEIESE